MIRLVEISYEIYMYAESDRIYVWNYRKKKNIYLSHYTIDRQLSADIKIKKL